jgi:hypothetical protein
VKESTPSAIANYNWGTTPVDATGIAIVNNATASASFRNELALIRTTISGRVYVESSSPHNTTDDGNLVDPGIAGVSITLSCSSPNFQAGPILTAADGSYSFSDVPAGAQCTILQTQPQGYTNDYTQTGLSGNPGTLGAISTAGMGTTDNGTIVITVPPTGSSLNNFAEQSADMVSATTCTPAFGLAGDTIRCTVTCTNNGPGLAANAICVVRNESSLPVGATVTCDAPTSLAAGAALSCTVSFALPAANTGSVTVEAGTGASNDRDGGDRPADGNNPSSASVNEQAVVPALGWPALLALCILLLAGGGWVFHRRS